MRVRPETKTGNNVSIMMVRNSIWLRTDSSIWFRGKAMMNSIKQLMSLHITCQRNFILTVLDTKVIGITGKAHPEHPPDICKI